MVEFRSRPNVALLVESSRSYGRCLLRGIAAYARTRSNWCLLHQEMTIDALPPEWLTTSSISGVIARVDSHTVARLTELSVPIVDVRCRMPFAGIPQVETDDATVAAMAFGHLWDRGFRRFAFCGFQYAHYSTARLKEFRRLVREAHCPLQVYETPGDRDAILTSLEQSGVTDAELADWLSSLEAPTGLFVCNDIRGQQVLNVCRRLGIAVPDDLGVIGVDDDDVICPLCEPPLSSIRPDAEQLGYRAAGILHDLMLGRPGPRQTEYVAPAAVVPRLSTQVDAVEDRELARVCRFVREHVDEGINVQDLVEFSSLSRRQLERRFRDQLNRTPHQEITLMQVARVRQLLRETPLTLEQIAPLAGYRHTERLCAVFRRETGETPGAFRRRAQASEEQ